MSTLKIAKWYPLLPFSATHMYVSYKAANPRPYSLASHVVNYNWLFAYSPGEIEPFKYHLSTHEHLIGLRNKPQ